jgi:hypothetical protein
MMGDEDNMICEDVEDIGWRGLNGEERGMSFVGDRYLLSVLYDQCTHIDKTAITTKRRKSTTL